MTEPNNATDETEPERPVTELIVEALEHLSAADRRRATAWVLARTTRQYRWLSREGEAARQPGFDPRLAQPPLRRVLAERGLADPATRDALAAQLLAGTQLKGEHQVVPVRLPAQLHAELRDWCAEHGFSMATVIRGLLTQFVEGQRPPEPEQGLEPDPE